MASADLSNGFGQAPDAPEKKRADAVARTGLWAACLNLLLALLQLFAGIASSAFSLIADAVHTLSDLSTDFLIAWASKRAGKPPDQEHPYGHGRLETLAELALGVVLIGVGAGFILAAGKRLQSSEIPALEPAAFGVAVLVLVSKEFLFHFLKARAHKLQAPLLLAAAWHARSDAASSLVVALGILAALLGFPALEPVAAAIVGFMIAAMGVRVTYRAANELIDEGLPAEEVEALAALIRTTPGVLDLHELRTRKVGAQVQLDAHVQVAPRISVSEGHTIADMVMKRLKAQRPALSLVTIHIDHEHDQSAHQPKEVLPQRAALRTALAEALQAQEIEDDWLQLHYLQNGLEVDLLLPEDFLQRHPELQHDAERQKLEAHLKALYPTLWRLRWFIALPTSPH